MSTADAPKKPRETDDVPVPATLRKSLKNRHIQLIALGGAIGTGLFYGCLLYTSQPIADIEW